MRTSAAPGGARRVKRAGAGSLRVPAQSSISRAFGALDRVCSGWVSKSVFLGGCEECGDLRSVLSQMFGQKLLEQPRDDLREDAAFIYGKLDVEGEGEVSLPQLLRAMPRIVSEIRPLQPDSPRVPIEVRMRWSRLVTMLRRMDAGVAVHAPIAALKRASERVRAALAEGGRIDARMAFASGLGALCAQLDGCDWEALPESELVSTTARLAELVELVADLEEVAALLPTVQRLHVLGKGKLASTPPGDLVAHACALLTLLGVRRGRADAALAGVHADAPLERRGVLRVVAARVEELDLCGLATLARHLARAGAGGDDAFVEVLVQQLAAAVGGTYGKALGECREGDLAALLWLLARHHLVAGASDLQDLAREVSARLSVRGEAWARRASDAELARTCWALGSLDLIGGPLPPLLAAQGSARAPALRAGQLVEVAWGLASLGERPAQAAAFADAAAQLGLALNDLTARELARLAAALGAWALPGCAQRLAPLWEALRARSNDLDGVEVAMVASAMVRLSVRDDPLLRSLCDRACRVGPFTAEGTAELLRWLEAYARLWPSQDNVSLAPDFALAACRRGIASFAAARVGPRIFEDVRSQALEEARRCAFRAIA